MMNKKICPTCKKELAADVETCPSCGTDMRSVAEIPEERIKAHPQLRELTNNSGANNPIKLQNQGSDGDGKRAWEIIGIVCGIVIFIVGLANINSIYPERFGGDFYTEIHEVTAACAKGIYGLYVVIGIAMVVYYTHKICEKK